MQKTMVQGEVLLIFCGRRVHRFLPCQAYIMSPLVLDPLSRLRKYFALFMVAEGRLLLDIKRFVLFSL